MHTHSHTHAHAHTKWQRLHLSWGHSYFGGCFLATPLIDSLCWLPPVEGDRHRQGLLHFFTQRPLFSFFSLGFRIMQTKHENKSSLRWRRTAFTNPGNFKSSLIRHPSPFSRTSLLAPCQSILNLAPLRSLLTKHLKVYSEASVLASFWKCRNQGMHVLSVSVGWLWVLIPVWFSLPFAAYSFTWTGALTQFPLRFPLFWYYLEGNRTWGGSTLRPRETHLPNRVGWASVGASHFSWLWREG